MNRQTLRYHLLGWGLLVAYDFVGIYGQHLSNLRQMLLLQFTFRLSMMSIFYYCFLLLFPRYLRKNRVPHLLLGLVLAPVVFAATRYALEQGLLPLLFGFSNYTGEVNLLHYLRDNVERGLPMMMVAATAWGVQDAFMQERRRETHQLLQEKTQAELAFLKTQINPHFLYNTLNYIYSEAYLVSEPLAEAVLRLSDLMRYMLHDSPDGKVEVRQEVAYLENYLALHRMRFEDKFFVEFTQQGAPQEQRVAALMLVPFVENALKHGIIHQAEKPVEIRLTFPTPQHLLFEVHNHISHHQKDHTTGIGLANLRRRLDLLYPEQYELAIENDGSVHHTRLLLPLDGPRPLPPATPPGRAVLAESAA
ncbi:Histidine kinase [Hymenobacter gelipurpurascens]|uniref:Histidine kinase n=1 Tax=Hymenobacter gelipurpurascens TaxID=89968 RepID=A0A212UDZ2_9BACT|nr:histidine kinase [Hymenobacter gelipurpurascens]SNC76465.1 Histidine kinase [Hymenobacter gelipurpurascens]